MLPYPCLCVCSRGCTVTGSFLAGRCMRACFAKTTVRRQPASSRNTHPDTHTYTQKWRVRYHTTCCVALYRSLVMEHQSKGSRFLFDGALSPPLLSPLSSLLVERDVVNSGVSKGTIGMPRRWNKCIFFSFLFYFFIFFCFSLSPKSISGVEFESRAMKLRRSK